MSDIAKKVKEKIVDAKDKVVDAKDKATGSEHADEREVSYTSSTKSDSTKEYKAKEPMSPAKISEHEPTAVKRENTETSKPTSVEDAKERLRRSGMTEGTAGST